MIIFYQRFHLTIKKQKNIQMKNVLILLFLAFSLVSSAQVINFPDAKFKNALVNTRCVDTDGNYSGDKDADLNNDGEIDVEEALKVINLNVDGKLISNLEGIGNFKNLSIFICSYNQIVNFDATGLKNLKILNCSQNKNLNYLNVKGLANLTSLSCSNNQLTTLDLSGLVELQSLHCFKNKLTSLDVIGLDRLALLYCTDNQLTSINVNGLNNLNYLYCGNNQLSSLFLKTGTFFYSLNFEKNPNLEYICSNDQHIFEMKNRALVYGLSNCEVNSYCTFTPGGKFYTLKGKNTFDGNVDGCDNQDLTFPFLKYEISNGNNLGILISNATGKYTIPIQAGTYTIKPIIEYSEYIEVTPSIYTITFPSSSDNITQNFCITPKSSMLRQTNITIIPLSPPARPGFDTKYKIVWENVGNQIEIGALNFTYDETLLDYISATQSPDQVADGIVKWNFTNLLPFEKREITVTLKVNRPTDTPAVNAGDKLYLTASILDNIFTLENTVVGSYDPNDKTCLQGDRVKPEMVGEYVDYLVRFENTGNYAAENVVIKDIIDTKTFDVSTLKITDASHEVYTRIEGNKVEFIFENIQLPFDDANNDGYIAFKIKTLSTLVLGDSLKNLADIYFDYNFPIRTNEAQTEINNPISSINDVTTIVNIYPNPVNDILYLDTKDVWTKAEIFDISGRIMRSVTLDSSSMDVSGLESGTYFIRLKHEDSVGLVKFVKI